MKAKLYKNPSIEVRLRTKEIGYAVYATDDISKGDIIEECHHVPWKVDGPVKNFPKFMRPYRWKIKKNDTTMHTIVLGYGSIFNSEQNERVNVVGEYYQDNDIFIFTALRDIMKYEELCINYHESLYEDRTDTI